MSLSKLWEIVKDRKAWHGAVNGVAKSRTQLSNFNFTFNSDRSWDVTFQKCLVVMLRHSVTSSNL